MRPASPSAESSPEPESIRPALPSQLEFVRALCRRLFLVYGSYDRYVEEWFSNAEVLTYVAEIDGAPAGFCMIRRLPSEPSTPAAAELLAIAVVPELQSRRVGQALLDRAFAEARRWQPPARQMRLSVAEGNARAQRMFGRNGFRMESAGGLYPAGQRARFMVKNLAPVEPGDDGGQENVSRKEEWR